MSRKIKELVERELKGRYHELNGALVLDVSRLTGVEANAFRGKLRAKGVEMHVVKNRAARRVLADSALSPVGKSLSGPCALITGASLVEVAKGLLELVKDYPAIVLKGGVIDGEPDFLTIEDISKRRTRLEIIAEAAAAAVAPGRRLAGCLRSPGGRLAGCLKALVVRLEKGEAVARVA
jgi:large subunit ribosomal protein L10